MMVDVLPSPAWAFPPSTWPRRAPPAGPFSWRDKLVRVLVWDQRERRTQSAPLPLVWRGWGVGVHRRITAPPPPRRFAPTLPTSGRVGPSARQRRASGANKTRVKENARRLGRRAATLAVVNSLVAQARRVGHLLPVRQAFGDDLRRLQRRLAQACVFDDLALHPRGLALQRVAQGLQLGDESVDFLHRGARHAPQQLV